jgi:mRNA guanylyltransferase
LRSFELRFYASSTRYHHHFNIYTTDIATTMGTSVNLSEVARIIPNEEAIFHRTTVADLLDRKQTGFPGAQPVSFARRHFAELQIQDYYLCEKTDGIRCLLYLTQWVQPNQPPQELQFLVDRKNQYWHVESNMMHLPKPGNMGGFHNATLLDGELVRQKYPDGSTRLMYLIFDCLCLDGVNITARPLDIRLGKLQLQIYTPWLELKKEYPNDVAEQPFHIQVKKMELPYGTEMVLKQVLPNLPHGNDGLIFTCKATPYVSGTDQHILKWKPPHENTIDFRLQIKSFPMDVDPEGEEYEDWDAKPEIDLLVFTGDKEGHRFYAKLALTDEEWEAIKRMNEMIDNRIIECYRDPSTNEWRPKIEHHDGTPRFRDDKTSANHVSTVESVEDSILDGVTEAELISNDMKVREAWKIREARARELRAEEKIRAAEAAKRQHQQQQQQRPPPPQQAVKVEPQVVKAEEEDDGPKYTD